MQSTAMTCPVGALQGLAPERVLYIGSASKRLAPGHASWLALDPSWAGMGVISASPSRMAVGG